MTFLFTLCLVIMVAAFAQAKVQIGSGNLELTKVNGVDTILVKKGGNLTLSCKSTSNVKSLTLEFASVVYNNTKNENGTYTVSYIKTAKKADNNQTVLCSATNSSGYKFEAKARVLFPVSSNTTITGIEDLVEDENATITCTITSTMFPPGPVTILYVPIPFSNPVVEAILKKTSLYKTTVVYDNKTDIYTTTVKAAPIPVTKSLNDQSFLCRGFVNDFQFFKGEKVIVSYGPKINNLNFWSSLGIAEGYSVTLTCSVTHSNPASNLTWYNNTAKFTPSTPAVVTKEGGTNYKTNQVWTFTYRRDMYGTNITCAANYKNRTVSKTLQIGVTKNNPTTLPSTNTTVQGRTVTSVQGNVTSSPSNVASARTTGGGIIGFWGCVLFIVKVLLHP